MVICEAHSNNETTGAGEGKGKGKGGASKVGARAVDANGRGPPSRRRVVHACYLAQRPTARLCCRIDPSVTVRLSVGSGLRRHCSRGAAQCGGK